jgi:hypothetical protein
MKKLYYYLLPCLLFSNAVIAQNENNPGSNHGNKFEQLGTMLSTPMSTARHLVRRGQNTGSKKPIMI